MRAPTRPILALVVVLVPSLTLAVSSMPAPRHGPARLVRDVNRRQVLALRLPIALETEITTRLDRAAEEITDGRDDDAIGTLREFDDEVARNAPGSIPALASSALRGRATELAGVVRKRAERGSRRAGHL